MARSNFGGVYANMDFPPYIFREYPKQIKTGDGIFEIVNSSEEETALRERLRTGTTKELDVQRERLIERAASLGVPINKKWSVEKLSAVIRAAEPDDIILDISANDDLPPEIEDPAEEESARDDKDALIAKAKALGISANKLWGIPRLKAQIAEAEANQE